MKRILSILVVFLFAIIALVSPNAAFAVVPPGGAPPVPQIGVNPGAQPAPGAAAPSTSIWVIDPEVTFIGKNAARSGLFLDWTLQNYHWSCVKQVGTRGTAQGGVNGQTQAIYCDNTNNPIAAYWSLIVLYIVVPLLFIVILATSIVIIITRGKSLTIMRFIPRFVAVVLLIVFSYALLQFFYQFTDLIQGFFLRTDINKPCPPDCIQQTNLLYVGWKYQDFIGLRLLGDEYAESAFISLLLTKLTALTYFVMVFLLLVRKIILWFFIIVSPIFPILLLYYPVRNTAKIWIGEFFRWLLYAPLFAIFLNGLVYLWKSNIPLVFTNAGRDKVDQVIFPTAVNILLGGPKEFVTPLNSLNLIETFALYVVSLIMLWIVILLPWILLQIFLDYASNFAPGDTAVMKTLVNMANSNKNPPAGGGGTMPPSTGAAISLPFSKKFSIPKDLQPQPTGEAKELNVQSMTASFAQPIAMPQMNNASVNAQVLSVANMKVPSMRDIAKYDAALTSRDASKQQETSRITQTLERIANPVSVTNTVERDQYVEIHEKISANSDKGNLVASSILNAASVTAKRNAQVSNQQMRESLKQMANPSLASSTNREKMSKLNNLLVKESQGAKGTQKSELSKAVLSVTDKTSDKEIEKIKSQLSQSSNTHVGKSVSSAVTQSAQASTQIKGVITQMANPKSVTHTADKQSVTKLKATLEKASAQGNQLASSILKVNDKTPIEEIEALQQRIQMAKEKGEPVATEVAALAQQTTALPSLNRVQNVSKEDYQAVRDMWKQNYQNLEVPQGMAGTRADWIKDDVEGIDETIGLLTSPDQDKVKEGMEQVSNILPFLMVGGFSQDEIVQYLQAKQDAAKEVSKTLAADEDDKVSVNATTTHAEKTMSATMEQSSTSSSSSSNASSSSSNASSSDDDDANDESPLANMNVANVAQSTTPVQPQVSNEILAMVDLKLPKLRDIAQYETRAMKKDATRTVEIEKMQSVLGKIANPSKITDTTERAQFEKVRQTLLDEKQKGNLTAEVLLNASLKAQGQPSDHVKSVLSQIANPSLATVEADKKRFTQLNESLTKASADGNELAKSILATHDATSVEDIQKLSEKLKEAKIKGEPVAQSVLEHLPEAAVPDANTLQPVSDADYEEVKKMWEENYRTLPVPVEFGSEATGRVAWIQSDVKVVAETIEQLMSPETEKQQLGMQKVSEIMPMLMLGGFSSLEIIGYLKAKTEAGTNVIAELQKEEEGKETVNATKETKAEENVLKVEDTNAEEKK
ncbi:MAG: hypothetical protein H0W89_01460 [Candidatus Levybacteria bacterium]|nr:hypothetical protein [Candidatus Levybacteria bacterium]